MGFLLGGDFLPLHHRAWGQLYSSLEIFNKAGIPDCLPQARHPRGLVALVGRFSLGRRTGRKLLCSPILRSVQHLLVVV